MTTQHGPEVTFKIAGEADLAAVLGLAGSYYQFDGIPFEAGKIQPGLQMLLADPAHGLVWLISAGERLAGYIIMTHGFDIEFGGRLGGITDFYLEPEHRQRGIGRLALEHVEKFCRDTGVKALELQVLEDNPAALAFYERRGFQALGRIPMFKQL
jgi:ribosomal protein S18 acetylase RimI-like enzyme